MDRFADFVIRQKKPIIVVFTVVALVCALLFLFVNVNYNMVDYLPPDAQSTKAITIMNEEFAQSMPNASVMIRNVSIPEALEYKEKLASVQGVTEVLWLDDMMDLTQPLAMGDSDTIEGFYKNGNALFTVTVARGMEQEASVAIRSIIGAENALAGEAPNLAAVQQATSAEVLNAMVILLPIVIIILVLSTASWVEPLLFMAAIGISIVINMGTNTFLGEISFMTNSVSPILQLAVSLDYAIFLLHSFADNRRKYNDVEEAMRHSIKESLSTVAASAATTLLGFLALVFMDFQIGADLGLNLAKGIIFSFITVMVFLPALTLSTYKIIDKTSHRDYMPNFRNINRVLSKLAIPVVFMVIILIVPSYLGQGKTSFIYGNGGADNNSQSGQARMMIHDEFGQSTIMALLVPRGDVVKEEALSRELKRLDHVTGVISYPIQVGAAIPPEFLGEEITGQFYSDNYARIVVYTDTPAEGALAFKTVKSINELAQNYFGSQFYSAGQSANLYDMKSVVQQDNALVGKIVLIAIFGVLLVTFKSATLPFMLLVTIKAGIWINLAIPYFTGTPVNYIGYLVINTVQLGATIDYAILLTDNYMRNRKGMPQRQAINTSLGATFKSILVSAVTLSTAGFTLFATSSDPIISDLGLLLGRGTILSLLMVVCFLPAMLTAFDKLIGKTTYRAEFFDQYGCQNDCVPKEEHHELQRI